MLKSVWYIQDYNQPDAGQVWAVDVHTITYSSVDVHAKT